MAAPTDDEPPLLLASVTLNHFKSYDGATFAGPFDDRQTTIVGPNGAGKSCLIEGICFALGAQQPSQAALSQLVHRSAASNATASVTVRFTTPDSSRHLVVERRIISGRRSEWRWQDCRCSAGTTESPRSSAEDADAQAWPCTHCGVRVIKRDALRQALHKHLKFDIDRPERLVVHQCTALAVASKAPTDLLAFLEGIIGTEALRDNVQREAARALALETTLGEHESALASARLAEGRHAPALLAFKVMESSRARLQTMKTLHLQREIAYHTSILHTSEAGVAALHSTVAEQRDQVDAKARALAEARATTKATEQAAAKAKAAHALAQRALARLRDESARLALVRKQHGAAESRAAKAMTALRSQLDSHDGSVRDLQMEQARLLAASRTLKEQLDHAKAQLVTREAAIDAIEAANQSEMADVAIGGCGRKRGRGGEARGPIIAPTTAPEALVLRRESELRSLMHTPAAATQLAARLRAERAMAERKRISEKEASRLQAARDGAARSLAVTRDDLAQQERACVEAEQARARHSATASEAERAGCSKQAVLDGLQTRLRAVQARLEESTALVSTSGRVDAVRSLRASSRALSGQIDGFLSEILTVSSEHACAANAALGGALYGTVVVHTKAAALQVVEHFARHKIGVVTCVILDELSVHQPDTPSSAPTGCTPLESCVRCEERHRPLVSKLLRKWSLAPNSRVALAATSRAPSAAGQRSGAHDRRRFDVVTLQGECFVASGEIRQAAAARSNDSFALSPSAQRLTVPSAAAHIGHQAASAGRGGGQGRGEGQVALLRAQVTELQTQLEAESRAARALHAQASAEERAAADAAERVATCSAAVARLSSNLAEQHSALGAAESKLAAKLASIHRAADAARSDGAARLTSAEDDTAGRIQQLCEETSRLRAALASGAADDDEHEVSAFDRPWHALLEDVRRLGDDVEAHMSAHDEAGRKARGAVSAKRSLQSKERALVQQHSTAQRLATDAADKEGALASKRDAAQQQATQAQAERDARAAEISSLSEDKEARSEELASARRALRRAEAAHNGAEAESTRQREALVLLQEQMGADVEPGCEAAGEEGQPEEAMVVDEEGDEDVEGGAGAAGAAAGLCMSFSEITKHRLALQAEERLFESKQRALDVASLEAYLQAAAEAAKLSSAVGATRADLEASSRKVETLQAERSRTFVRGLTAIDAGLRATFRALCRHGDCSLDYATQPAILFVEGVRIAVKLPQGEWTRFEGLSGGQQALVAVALNLALREADGASLVLFDEIDAALDTQRVQALADYVRQKSSVQTVFVSHRKELIEASGRLLGTYTLDGASQSVSVGFA